LISHVPSRILTTANMHSSPFLSRSNSLVELAARKARCSPPYVAYVNYWFMANVLDFHASS